MILNHLVELARREALVAERGYGPREVRWLIAVDPEGRFLGAHADTQGRAVGKSGKHRPLIRLVPQTPPRSSNDAATLLVDNVTYVLGISPDKPLPPHQLARRHRLFGDLIRAVRALAPADPGLAAVLGFLDDPARVAQAAGAIVPDLRPGDLIAFRLAGRDDLVHDAPAVRAAWQALSRPRSGGEAEAGGEAGGEAGEGGEAGRPSPSPAPCQVCGSRERPLRIHAQIKRVPGAPSAGVRLISFAADSVMSFGMPATARVPLCEDCGEAYAAALSRLFDPAYPAPGGSGTLPPRRVDLSPTTALLFWAAGPSDFPDAFRRLADGTTAEEAQAEDVDPDEAALAGEKLGHVYERLWERHPAWFDDASPFHFLVISGSRGRMIVRDQQVRTVAEASGALRAYFADMAMAPRSARPRPPSVRSLLKSLCPRGDLKTLDPNLGGRFVLSLLTGQPLPGTILRAAVDRLRAEQDDRMRGWKHSPERLGLIRAALKRGPARLETTPMLDPDCRVPAYCLGRLFAALERLQVRAIGAAGTTIVQQYYGSASTTPLSAFGALLRKATVHAAKVGRNADLEIQEILGLLGPADGLPPIFRLEEQALFGLGYYHQRAHSWQAAQERIRARDAGTNGAANDRATTAAAAG
jgi:CRISPR-associated protein Csd1